MEKFCGRHGAREGLDTIRCFTSIPSRKLSRNFRRKRKTGIAIAERPLRSCSWHFPPCYSLGSYGDEVEEKEIGEKKIRSGKREAREESGQSAEARPTRRRRSEARCRHPCKTGSSVSQRYV